jgi:hypothetical protein
LRQVYTIFSLAGVAKLCSLDIGNYGMKKEHGQKDTGSVTDIYQEFETWHVNLGDKTIHAKRMPGFYRSLKYLTGSLWLLFFLVPYVRWNGKQAILFDIGNRQFHFFNLTVLPQDIWMLSLLLLVLAMTLFAVTSLRGYSAATFVFKRCGQMRLPG